MTEVFAAKCFIGFVLVDTKEIKIARKWTSRILIGLEESLAEFNSHRTQRRIRTHIFVKKGDADRGTPHSQGRVSPQITPASYRPVSQLEQVIAECVSLLGRGVFDRAYAIVSHSKRSLDRL